MKYNEPNSINMNILISRRNFIGTVAAASVLAVIPSKAFLMDAKKKGLLVSAHVWPYSSQFRPNYDCSPIMEQVFMELKSAGFDGVELQDVNFQSEDSVSRISALIKKYELPVTGSSFSGDMFNRAKHGEILANATMVIDRLHQVGGETFGVSVGDAKHLKTKDELDAQAELLKKIISLCNAKEITLNIHNHTYEVQNNLYDLKGIIERIPDIKLGPDINWLIRAGVDPVWFINTYGKNMVYMHLRDQKASGKWAEAIGDGVTDFRAVAEALKKCSFKGRIAVELAFDEPTTRPLPENLKISCEYIKKIFL
jgi:sugar phosphate isomerase/epimerase